MPLDLRNTFYDFVVATGTICVALYAVCGCRNAKNSTVSVLTPKVSAKAADSTECLVCHNDFGKELISAKHERAGIGCTWCHGPSGDHGGDELNITPPDILFGRSEIEPFCSKCHKPKDHPKGKVYQEFVKNSLGNYRPNGRRVNQNSVCTDCHGNHAVLSPDRMLFPTE